MSWGQVVSVWSCPIWKSALVLIKIPVVDVPTNVRVRPPIPTAYCISKTRPKLCYVQVFLDCAWKERWQRCQVGENGAVPDAIGRGNVRPANGTHDFKGLCALCVSVQRAIPDLRTSSRTGGHCEWMGFTNCRMCGCEYDWWCVWFGGWFMMDTLRNR